MDGGGLTAGTEHQARLRASLGGEGVRGAPRTQAESRRWGFWWRFDSAFRGPAPRMRFLLLFMQFIIVMQLLMTC